VQAVRTALLRATEYMEKNRDATIAYLAKEFKLDPADMADVYAVNRYPLAMDTQMVADLDALAEFLLGLKRIQSSPKARDWIDPAPLRSVRADLVQYK